MRRCRAASRPGWRNFVPPIPILGPLFYRRIMGRCRAAKRPRGLCLTQLHIYITCIRSKAGYFGERSEPISLSHFTIQNKVPPWKGVWGNSIPPGRGYGGINAPRKGIWGNSIPPGRGFGGRLSPHNI